MCLIDGTSDSANDDVYVGFEARICIMFEGERIIGFVLHQLLIENSQFVKILNRLILPVVIRLSKRLSHARLSLSN